MSKQNISLPLSVIDRYLEVSANPKSFSQAEQVKAAKEMHESVIEARRVLSEGYDRQNLTVCSGRLGYVDPEDARRLMSGEIPRLTVYRKKSDNRHMRLYFKHTPKFYKENSPCKIEKSATDSISMKTIKKAPKPRVSSGQKPTKS